MATRAHRLIAILEAQDRATPVIRGLKGALGALGAVAAVVGVQQIGRALVQGLGKAIEEAAKAEAVDVRLAQAIRNSGQSVDEVLPKLKAQASALQDVTGVGDETIKSGQALLVGLGRLRGEGLERATKATLDFSVATGMDLDAAFKLVAKAAAGQTSALSRYGIKVDESIPKQERFNAVLGKMEEVAGGQAQARLRTYEGRVAEFHERIGDLREELGGPFRDVMKSLLGEFLSPLVKELTTAAGKSTVYRDAVFDVAIAQARMVESGLALGQSLATLFAIMDGGSVISQRFLQPLIRTSLIMEAFSGRVDKFAGNLKSVGDIGELLGLARTGASLGTLRSTAEGVGQAVDASDRSLLKLFDTARTGAHNAVLALEDMKLSDRDFLIKIGVDADAVLRLRDASTTVEEFRKKLLDLVKLNPEQFDQVIARLGPTLGKVVEEVEDAAEKGTEAVKAAGLTTLAEWQQQVDALKKTLRDLFSGDGPIEFRQLGLDELEERAEKLHVQLRDIAPPDLAPFLDPLIEAPELLKPIDEGFVAIDETIAGVVDRALQMDMGIGHAAEMTGLLAEGMRGVDAELTRTVLGVLNLQDAVGILYSEGLPALQRELRNSKLEIGTVGEQLDTSFRQIGISAALQLGDALVDAAAGAEFSFKKFLKALAIDLAKAIVQALILRAILAAVGLKSGGSVPSEAAVETTVPFKHGGFPLAAMATMAGRVPGISHGRDSVPALLEPGELVIPRRMAAQVVGAARHGGMPDWLGQQIAALPGVSGVPASGDEFGKGGLAPERFRKSGVRKKGHRERVDYSDRILSPEIVEHLKASLGRYLGAGDLTNDSTPAMAIATGALVLGPQLVRGLQGERPGSPRRDLRVRQRDDSDWIKFGRAFATAATAALVVSSGGAGVAVVGHQAAAGRKRGGVIGMQKGGLVPGAALGFDSILAHLDPGDVVYPGNIAAELRTVFGHVGDFSKGQVPVRLAPGEAVIPAELVKEMRHVPLLSPRLLRELRHQDPKMAFAAGGTVPGLQGGGLIPGLRDFTAQKLVPLPAAIMDPGTMDLSARALLGARATEFTPAVMGGPDSERAVETAMLNSVSIQLDVNFQSDIDGHLEKVNARVKRGSARVVASELRPPGSVR